MIKIIALFLKNNEQITIQRNIHKSNNITLAKIFKAKENLLYKAIRMIIDIGLCLINEHLINNLLMNLILIMLLYSSLSHFHGLMVFMNIYYWPIWSILSIAILALESLNT